MLLRTKILIGLLILLVTAEGVALCGSRNDLKELRRENELLIKELEELEEQNILTDGIESKAIGEHILTFYTHTGNRTATGVYPKAGRTVAVDTKYIPHGTVLYIEGVGLRIAEDTGGKIKGNRLDVFVDTKEEAIKKGVKKAKVHIIKGMKK